MLSRFEPGNRAAAADTEVISDCQNIEIGVCKQIGKTGVRDIDSPVFLCFSRSLRVFFARRDDFALRIVFEAVVEPDDMSVTEPMNAASSVHLTSFSGKDSACGTLR